MKVRNAVTLCIIVLFAAAGFAQSNMTASLMAGYSMSAFQDQGSAAGTVVVGASIGFKAAPALEVGGEFVYPIGGYKFKTEVPYLDESVTTTFNQMMAGAYGKYFIGQGSMKPFLKAGVGYYFGNVKSEMGSEKLTADLKAAVGFNVGGGIQTERGLSVGFTFNIVKREDAGMNTWAVTIGYPIIK